MGFFSIHFLISSLMNVSFISRQRNLSFFHFMDQGLDESSLLELPPAPCGFWDSLCCALG